VNFVEPWSLTFSAPDGFMENSRHAIKLQPEKNGRKFTSQMNFTSLGGFGCRNICGFLSPPDSLGYLTCYTSGRDRHLVKQLVIRDGEVSVIS